MTKKNSLLWSIQQDGQLKGYIFGTMHIDKNIAFSNASNLYQAIDQSTAFATEVPLDVDTQTELSKHLLLPNYGKLSELFNARKFEKMSVILSKSWDINLLSLNRFLPMVVHNIMTQKTLTPETDSPNDILDFHLWNYASAQGMETMSIESIQDHIQTLHQIPIAFQMKSLLDACRQTKKFRAAQHSLLDLYKNQEIHQLYRVSKKSLGSIKEIMLYKRNREMVESIHAKIQNHILFAAIGAGHLSGKKGMIHLLKEKNYQLTPIHIEQQ